MERLGFAVGGVSSEPTADGVIESIVRALRIASPVL
jgi:hypothetical protein